MRTAVLAAVLAAVFAVAACTTPDGKPAPYGAMFSVEEALKTVFEDVCAPAILEGKSVETLARGRGMIEVDARGVGAGANDREWRLASLGDASVTAWADGTCMASVEQGDPEKHRAYLLSVMETKGVKLAKSPSRAGANGATNTVYCSAGAKPVVLSLLTPTPGGNRKLAMVANLVKPASRPPACPAG